MILSADSGDRRHVPRMIAVALCQRKARIAGDHPLRQRLGERDPAALVIAHLALVKSRRGDVPAKIRAERRLSSTTGTPPISLPSASIRGTTWSITFLTIGGSNVWNPCSRCSRESGPNRIAASPG